MDYEVSARGIPGFIENFSLDETEFETKTSEFKTFNQFFKRTLKPSARPIANPDDSRIIVSPVYIILCSRHFCSFRVVKNVF